jgi:putative transposase
MFELFDPKQEVHIREGSLPHWYQPGVTYFVTFRTEDSVPQSLAKAWHAERDQWLREHSLDPGHPAWRKQLSANPEWDRQYHARFTRQFMEYLDRGMGTCPLRDRSVAEIVAKSLMHFHGERYVLGDYVVMPNHVHLLVCLRGATTLEGQCYSWKRYTAGQINLLLNRTGRFWQEESFDHLVRSPEQFEYFERYIAKNPEKAGLSKGDYLHRVRPK